jgi:hypothetical protein
MKKNPSPRVSILPSGEIIKTEGKRTIQFAQGESISLHRNLYLALRENPSPRLSVLPSGAIVSTQAHNIKALPSKGIRSLDRNVYLALRENPSPRLSILPSGGIVSTKANNIKVVSTMEIIPPNKNIHVVLRENPSPRIAILPEGDIVFGKTNDIKALPQQEIVPLHKNVSLPILQNPAPRLALLPPGEIVSTRHSNAGQISRSLQERISLMIKESPPQRITILSAGDIVTAKRQTTSSLNKKITNASGHAPSLTVEQNKSTTVTKSPSPDSLSLTIKAGDTTAKKLVVFHRDSIALPEDYAERKKNVIRTLSVNTDSVILRVYDNGIVDGDIVSVIYNDNVVIDKLSLTSRAVVVKIPVDRSQVNTLVFHAHNLGSYPPNTAKLEILYGNKKEELTVSSDLTVSSTIDLVHQ